MCCCCFVQSDDDLRHLHFLSVFVLFLFIRLSRAGFQVPCPHGHAPSPATPLCHRHGHQEEEEQKKSKGEEEERQQEEKKKQQHRFLPAAGGLFQGHTHLMMSSPTNRRRIFSLEPFHQSSIISSRLKRGREEGREGEDKRSKVTGEHRKRFLLVAIKASCFLPLLIGPYLSQTPPWTK